ncbi:MAG TPA: MqnA/MqnD/SBP family protein [Edaphobacter sp.]|nr:MqnA/MqnD/SBP family protein [Edaphobacter sp.]
MLQQADAALLIGDPALLAIEHRSAIEERVGPCQWFDIAHEWTTRTNLPWVAAVWAIRPEALTESHVSAATITRDLIGSRDHGLAHIEDLVTEWAPRLGLPPTTVRDYLSVNIHYTLSDQCVEAIRLFRSYAAELEVLPPLPNLRFL